MVILKTKEKENALKLKAVIRIKLKAQSATSGQPVGPLLGQYGIPLIPFCKEFNERTLNYNSDVEVFVILKLFVDNSYTFVIKMPSLSFLIIRASRLLVANSVFNPLLIIDEVEVPSITVYQLYEVVNYIQLSKKCTNTTNNVIKELLFKSLGTLKSINSIS